MHVCAAIGVWDTICSKRVAPYDSMKVISLLFFQSCNGPLLFFFLKILFLLFLLWCYLLHVNFFVFLYFAANAATQVWDGAGNARIEFRSEDVGAAELGWMIENSKCILRKYDEGSGVGGRGNMYVPVKWFDRIHGSV